MVIYYYSIFFLLPHLSDQSHGYLNFKKWLNFGIFNRCLSSKYKQSGVLKNHVNQTHTISDKNRTQLFNCGTSENHWNCVSRLWSLCDASARAYMVKVHRDEFAINDFFTFEKYCLRWVCILERNWFRSHKSPVGDL